MRIPLMTRDRACARAGRRRHELLAVANRAERRVAARHQPAAQHAVAGRLPDPVAGRSKRVHGVDPAALPWRPEDRSRHLGRAARQRRPAVGPAGQPRRPRSTRPPTTSARHRSAATGCSSSAERSPAASRAARATSTSRASTARTSGARPSISPCVADGGPNWPSRSGPVILEAEARQFLYFSSGPDIYAAKRGEDGDFGPGAAVTALNSAAADIQPNVRKDGREVVFASNRDAAAGQDIWASTRDSAHDPWSAPVNLGPAVNTSANETRPSLSWDGKTLYFGRAPGQESSASDIFVTTRERLHGS